MELKAAVEITKMLANSDNRVVLANIIVDDNTTTMTQLCNKKDNGMMDDSMLMPKKRGDVDTELKSLNKNAKI
eukprot:925570-Ditylum_brightwellii.AAC.1